MDDNRCAVRDGRALLAGLVRCGHCGRKLRVVYNRKSSAMYYLPGGLADGERFHALAGKTKPFGTKLAARDYREVRALDEEYLRRVPRNVAPA